MRINRYLAACGLCSRRDADRLIEAGRVLINGRPAGMGIQVGPDDTVTVDGRRAILPEGHIVYVWYKPRGVVCTARDPHAERTVIQEVLGILEREDAMVTDKGRSFAESDGIKPLRLTYIGRLDKDSEGLLLLTDDGVLVQSLSRSENRVEKEYQVTVDGTITGECCARLAGGVFLKELGLTTRPCEVIPVDRTGFRIILTEGKNRQIRRMCETVGLRVKRLIRIREGDIALGSMQPGELRRLTAKEQERLYAYVHK